MHTFINDPYTLEHKDPPLNRSGVHTWERLWVCKCVCVSVCVCACVCVCVENDMYTLEHKDPTLNRSGVHTCMHTRIHTRTHSYMHTFIHAHIHTCTHSYMHAFGTFTGSHALQIPPPKKSPTTENSRFPGANSTWTNYAV